MNAGETAPVVNEWPHKMTGLALMAGAMMLLPCMDAIAKYMAGAQTMSPAQVTFYRFFFQMVLIAPFLLPPLFRGELRIYRPWVNIGRGAAHGLATFFFFMAVKYLPLTDAFAVYFVEPFILAGLTFLFLGETIGTARWVAIFVGFIGSMIVLKPNLALFGPLALLPLGSAFFFALYLFSNRAVGTGDRPAVMQALAGLGGTLFMTPVMVVGQTIDAGTFGFSLPASLPLLGLLLILGMLSGAGHLIVLRAFQLAPISILASFQYFEIVSATILGLIFFGDFPDPVKWFGILVIISSGLYVSWRAHRG